MENTEFKNRQYQKPEIEVVELAQTPTLLAASGPNQYSGSNGNPVDGN